MVSASVAGYGGRLPARHTRRFLRKSTGPRFPVRAVAFEARGRSRGFLFALSAFGLLERVPKSSASSWQGLVLGPGGAPVPPEWLAAKRTPRAPRPVPLRQRLAKAPIVGRGVGRIIAAEDAWIRFPPPREGAVFAVGSAACTTLPFNGEGWTALCMRVIPAKAGIQLAPEARKKKTGPRLSPG